MRESKATIQLNKGLKKAGMDKDDLPVIKCSDSSDTGKEFLCYKYILGNCPAGERCGFVHVPSSHLKEKTLGKILPPLTKVIKEGLEKLPPEDAPRKRGSKRKRQGGAAHITVHEE